MRALTRGPTRWRVIAAVNLPVPGSAGSVLLGGRHVGVGRARDRGWWITMFNALTTSLWRCLIKVYASALVNGSISALREPIRSDEIFLIFFMVADLNSLI